MLTSAKLFLVSVIMCGVWALPPETHEETYGKAKVIDESDYKKHCPAGFDMIGKRCAKTVVVPPSSICPHGTIKLDKKCVEYIGKKSECPYGYEAKEEGCIKISKVHQEFVCPDNFILQGKDKCVKKMALPEVHECPIGTLLKGDLCVKVVTESPIYKCPSEYQKIGKYCQHEVKFDCTPARKPSENHSYTKGETQLRHSGKESHMYHLSVESPTVEEYVVQETCKRVITEEARPSCPKDGIFTGKECEKNVIVPPIVKPGGYHDVYAPAYAQCPEGYLEANKESECLNIDYAPPQWFCPEHTKDLGEKCARYSEPKIVCPEHFYMTGKTCAQTVFASPLVEYTVTYACTGKECVH